MKALLKKIKKGILESRKRRITLISQPTVGFIDVCIVLLLGLLPFTAVRISLGDTSVGVISCAIIILFGIFLFTAKKHGKSVFFKYKWTHYCILAIFLVYCLIAIMTNTLHGWGIFLEWLVLPIVFGIIILHRLEVSTYFFDCITVGMVLALAGVVLSGSIFSLYGVFTFDGRLYALWPSANHLALFVAPLLAFSASLLITRKGIDVKYQVLLGFLLFGGLSILYFTKSFAGVLALVSALVLIAIIYFKTARVQFPHHHTRGMIVFGVLFGVFLLAFVEKSGVILQNLERSSLASRITIYEVSIDMIRHSPLVGIDLGSFQEEYLSQQKNYEPYLEWAVPLPHNTLLAFWLYGGVGGLFMFLLATAKVLHVFLYASVKHKQKTLPFLAALITMIIHGLVDTSFFRQDLAIMYCLILFMILGLTRSQKDFNYSS